jgi:CRP/FNR family cyclic AMP-dependent transcriptional regulator
MGISPEREVGKMETIVDILTRSVIFRNLTKEQIEKLAAIASVEVHPAGTLLYKEGDPADKFYIVQEGKVVLNMKCDMGPHVPPMQVTVDLIVQGESMGWSAVVEPHLFTLSCLCMDPTKLVAIDAAKLREIISGDLAVGFEVMKAMAKLIASRLTHTRILLIGERALGLMMEQTQYA